MSGLEATRNPREQQKYYRSEKSLLNVHDSDYGDNSLSKDILALVAALSSTQHTVLAATSYESKEPPATHQFERPKLPTMDERMQDLMRFKF